MVNGCRRVPRPPARMTARLMPGRSLVLSSLVLSSWVLSFWVSDAWSRPGRCCRRPAACTALASRLQKDQVSGLPPSSTSRKPVTSPSAASEGSASGHDSKVRLASCSAFAVALLLLGAVLWTLFEKNLVSTLTQQGWTRELYGISTALTKLRFGVGGSAIDQRLFATLTKSGLTDEPDPASGVRFPDNLLDVQLLQSALLQAQTIDLPPPRPANAQGDYIDLMGFSGEDTGLGTYAYLAFRAFGVNVPSLTYLYFVIVAASLVLS